ncbi:HEPN domain-containing protein [bacterium]|nr:HEPN domain-containing protein [bacterium]
MSHNLYTGVSEQAKASKHRLDDVRALFNTVRWRGAMYMAGYAVECLLKTKLMRIYGCRNLHELEDELQRRGILARRTTVFTHQLELLLRLTQGFDRLRQNRTFWPQFNIVNRWIPAWRYTADLSNRQDAEDFLEAVENLMRWIENNV